MRNIGERIMNAQPRGGDDAATVTDRPMRGTRILRIGPSANIWKGFDPRSPRRNAQRIDFFQIGRIVDPLGLHRRDRKRRGRPIRPAAQLPFS